MYKILSFLFLLNCFNFIFANNLNNNINNVNKDEHIYIKDFKIMEDQKFNSIKLEYKNINLIEMYIWRSYYKEFDFKIIGTTKNPVFSDRDTSPGIQYWYKISFLQNKDENIANTGFDNKKNSDNYVKEFHRKIIVNQKNFNQLLKDKNKKNPVIKNKKLKNKTNNELKLINEFYKNPIKLFFIYNTTKMYIEKNDLLVLTDFNNYTADYKNKKITIYNFKKDYMVLLHSKKIFRCKKKIKNRRLFNRLIQNSIAFVIKKGEKLIELEKYNKYALFYEAVGLATLYYKQDINWRNNSIIFGTNNKKLKKKLNEIQRKYNEVNRPNY